MLRILSIALEKELKVLDYAFWLWLFSFVSAFLTSLIKLILWLKFSTGKRQAEDMGGGGGGQGPYGPAPFQENTKTHLENQRDIIG